MLYEAKNKNETRKGPVSLRFLIRENLRCNIGVLWLGLIVMLFNYPVNLALQLSGAIRDAQMTGSPLGVYSDTIYADGPTAVFTAQKTELAARLSDLANNILNGRRTAIEMIIFAAAVLCAVAMFQHHYNRKAVDFYASQPVTRTRRFAADYLCGVLIMVICMAVGFIGALLVCAGFHAEELLIGQAVLVQAGYFMNFLLCYSLCVLSMQLMGSRWSAVGAVVCLFAAGPVLRELLESLANVYFTTYVYSEMDGFDWMYRLSPIVLLSDYAELVTGLQYHTASAMRFLSFDGRLFLFAAIVTAIALLCCRMRPSESAGRTVAFSWLSRPVRMILSVLGGILFSFIGAEYSPTWLLFFLLIGTMLSHAILEVLIRLDVRAALSHRIETGACALIAALIVGCFLFDPFGYDRYLPKEEALASVSLIVDGDEGGEAQLALPETEYERQWLEETGGTSGTSGIYYPDSYYEGKPSLQKRMALTESETVEAVLALVQTAPEFDENRSRLSRFADLTSIDGSAYLLVSYRLKDGREKSRRYDVSKEAIDTYMPEIFASRQYKEALWPILTFEPASSDAETLGRFGLLYREDSRQYERTQKAKEALSGAGTFSVNGIYTEESVLNLSTDEALSEELLAALKKDLYALTYDELENYTSYLSGETEAAGIDSESGEMLYAESTGVLRYTKDMLFYQPPLAVQEEQKRLSEAAKEPSYDAWRYQYEDSYPIYTSFTAVRSVLRAHDLLPD